MSRLVNAVGSITASDASDVPTKNDGETYQVGNVFNEDTCGAVPPSGECDALGFAVPWRGCHL